MSVMTCDLSVIPGRREAANPESIGPSEPFGFRARAFGAPRNVQLEDRR
jgi:hypothetical protein